MCIFFVPYHDPSSLFLIQAPYLNRKLRKEIPILVITPQFITDFANFDNICHVILKKKLFFSGVIVSVNRRRKDIKVTFVSFSFHSGRFIVICKEDGNKLFSYFDIFKQVSLNFTLDKCQMWFLKRWGFSYAIHLWKIKREKNFFP